jgi:O-methyltransferase
LIFVPGDVAETLKKIKPENISLLRLDTDWYASTVKELETLYPLLVEKGVLIIDDYGHFDGARKAVNEYFQNRIILLNRIDYTGRIGIKIS